jgi:HAD superfamily hydrolase (TIGR01509 family)
VNKFNGIIFDFNGVLLWDSPLQEKAWIETSLELRGKTFSKDEIINIVHGRPNKAVFEYLLSRPVVGKELNQLIQHKESKYRSLCLLHSKDFKLSPGAVDFLDFVVKQNIPHTIATASEKSNLDFFIEHLKLDYWFDITKIVYDDGKLLGKPNPDIYLKAAENIGLKPQECVVVEDAISGINAAHSANIGKIIALGCQNDHDRLRNIEGVDIAITQINKIPKEYFK